MLSENVHGLTH